MDKQNSSYRQKIIEMTKNPMMSEFTGQRIVQRLTEKDLIKLDKLMKKHPLLNISTFLRIFRRILKPNPEQDFYLTYGLFRLFQEICISSKKYEVTFNDISTIITQKMPSFNQEIKLSEKLYPLQFDVPDSIKKKIYAPDVVGKVMQQRQRLQETPYLFDKFLHLNRRVGISYYSPKNKMFITNDQPSVEIKLLNEHFQIIKTLKTQQEISKRDSIVTHMAWSEHEERLAVLLGNYSISLWAKEDNYRFEVNVPLPLPLLTSPYIIIGFLQCSKLWYTIDNHPSIYILSNYNFEPQYKFTHFKMIKQKESQKILSLELKYRKLLCLAFQRSVFLISLEKRELITQLRNFKTSITSIAFSQTFQALFISTFENYFSSYQLSQHVDLTERGKFQGHKNLISIIGVLQGRPVVYSIDQKSIIKLWDIRDFQCYQSFSVLKNVQYRQVIALPESVCLIGSKHFCYQWQRFTVFRQAENVIYINQLKKNILIVTGKQIRVYNHSNGVLMSVAKGIFQHGLIIKASLVQIRKFIVLMNDQGLTKIYSTKDFTQISVFNLLPKPNLIHYQKQTELITLASMGEVRISQLKQLADLPLKRRIHNQKDMIKFCQVSSLHDLITIQYQYSPYLFFYSYERAKLMGFLVLQGLVTLKLLPSNNVIVIVLKDKLLIATYKKSINAITFFVKGMTELWQKAEINNYGINFSIKNFSQIVSTDLVVFQDNIVVTSNDACFQCILSCNFKSIDCVQVKINREYYNPYRIASEDHLETFDVSRPSVVIQEKVRDLFREKRYVKHPGNKNFKLLSQINLFYCVADEKEVIFYNQNSEIRGCINFKQTLPLNWNLHNYSQEQFNELQFVLQFIQQQQTKNEVEDVGTLAASFTVEKPNELITMNMLTPTKSKANQEFKSMSLRQKKMILQKERDQKQKYDNYLQIRRNEELVKQKNINSSTNQKYISQSLAFLNINRNKLLLSKGIPEIELPQIRALQFKLNAAVNRDEKKSIVSKYSVPLDYNSPLRKVAHQEYSKAVTKTTTQLKLLPESQLKQGYKQQIKRLELSLKQSKFKRPARSTSLPALKVS